MSGRGGQQERAAQAVLILERIQRLLRDSRYTTTYKFAVLRALCDIAVESDPKEDRVPLNRLAEHVIGLYWRQVQPFQHTRGSGSSVLQQSNDPNHPAAALKLVSKWSTTHHASLHSAREDGQISIYAKELVTLLKKDVLKRLQPPGEPSFLYDMEPRSGAITMRPHVMDTLRRFHGLLSEMIESEWSRWVERRNPGAVRGSEALREHLFGVDRECLRAAAAPLLQLQQGRCFYSKDRITLASADVDHFIPWSLARHDAVGNLVLASRSVNRSKSNRLPSIPDRDRWLWRNDEHEDALRSIAADARLPFDPKATRRVCDWAYERWSVSA